MGNSSAPAKTWESELRACTEERTGGAQQLDLCNQAKAQVLGECTVARQACESARDTCVRELGLASASVGQCLAAKVMCELEGQKHREAMEGAQTARTAAEQAQAGCVTERDECRTSLSTAEQARATCTTERDDCRGSLTAAQQTQATCTTERDGCHTALTACRTERETVDTQLEACRTQVGTLTQRLQACSPFLSWEVAGALGDAVGNVTHWVSVQDPQVYLVATANGNPSGGAYGVAGRLPTRTTTGVRTNFAKLSLLVTGSPVSRTVFLVFTQHSAAQQFSCLLQWTGDELLRNMICGNTTCPGLPVGTTNGPFYAEDPYDLRTDAILVVGFTTTDLPSRGDEGLHDQTA